MSRRYRLEEQHKRILEVNRYLLTKNVVHTPELHSRLLTDKVVTESMLRDIQEGKNQQERNERLINVLKLRNKNAFRKFTYILMFTGHSLIADFLHDEEKSGAQLVTSTEIERRLPTVANCLALEDMKRLCHYIESKIKCEVAKKTWNASEQERDRIEEIRNDCYFREEEKQRLLDKSNQKIKELEARLEQVRDDQDEKEQRIKELKTTITQIEVENKECLSKQMRFNTANNTTITKLSERLVHYTRHITELTTKLQQSLGELFKEQDIDPTFRYTSGILSDKNKAKSEDRRKIAELDSVISLLLRAAQNFNQDIKTMENTRGKERDTVLALLGTNSRDKQITTTDALRQFINRENKEKQHFLRDIQAIGLALKGDKQGKSTTDIKLNTVTFDLTGNGQTSTGSLQTDFRSLRTSLGMLREEIQHVSKRLQWKEAQIKALEDENAELKTGALFRGRGRLDLGNEGKAEVTSPPMKHKSAAIKSKNLTRKPKKPVEQISTRLKQRVLSPIDEVPQPKPTNSIVFPSLDKDPPDTSQPIPNKA